MAGQGQRGGGAAVLKLRVGAETRLEKSELLALHVGGLDGREDAQPPAALCLPRARRPERARPLGAGARFPELGEDARADVHAAAHDGHARCCCWEAAGAAALRGCARALSHMHLLGCRVWSFPLDEGRPTFDLDLGPPVGGALGTLLGLFPLQQAVVAAGSRAEEVPEDT